MSEVTPHSVMLDMPGAPPVMTPTGTTPAVSPASNMAIKIISLDYYLAPPLEGVDITWSELEGAALERVPVVRIFGSTPAGQKACVHLHKVQGRI